MATLRVQILDVQQCLWCQSLPTSFICIDIYKSRNDIQEYFPKIFNTDIRIYVYIYMNICIDRYRYSGIQSTYHFAQARACIFIDLSREIAREFIVENLNLMVVKMNVNKVSHELFIEVRYVSSKNIQIGSILKHTDLSIHKLLDPNIVLSLAKTPDDWTDSMKRYRFGQ
jgi:hypothetical protein